MSNSSNTLDTKDSKPIGDDNYSRPTYTRNPITGIGLNGDGFGGLKTKIAKSRAGNPVTGEGYRTLTDDYKVLKKQFRR